MGLLDEAIREHLELKRAHGADPAEVAQLEREAFGPAPTAPAPLELPDRERAEAADPALVEPGVDAPDPAPAGEEPTRLQSLPPPVPERDELTWEEPEPAPGRAAPAPPAAAPEPAPLDDPQSTRAFSASEVAEARGRGQQPPAPPRDIPETAEHDHPPQPDREP